jgi:ribosomal protein S18 acetylase RimI-like enzyme
MKLAYHYIAMNTITIRKATLADLPVLKNFEQGVIQAERPFDHTLKADPIHYYDIVELIQAAHIEMVVAETDGKLIGSGYARIEQSKHYLKHQAHAYLGFMYVDPEYRGKGVNKKIMETLKKWAITQNITELRLDVYDGNTSAIKAYEKVGFSNYMVHMRMGLEDDLQ